jgi:hypothetical protein
VLANGGCDARSNLTARFAVTSGPQIGSVAPGFPQFFVAMCQVGVAHAFPLAAMRLSKSLIEQNRES